MAGILIILFRKENENTVRNDEIWIFEDADDDYIRMKSI